jgi:hypothetical protein
MNLSNAKMDNIKNADHQKENYESIFKPFWDVTEQLSLKDHIGVWLELNCSLPKPENLSNMLANNVRIAFNEYADEVGISKIKNSMVSSYKPKGMTFISFISTDKKFLSNFKVYNKLSKINILEYHISCWLERKYNTTIAKAAINRFVDLIVFLVYAYAEAWDIKSFEFAATYPIESPLFV